MKNLSTLFLIGVLCVAFSLGFMEVCRRLRPITPAAVAASDVRAVDELIGKRVEIKFITGAGYGQSHEKVKGLILKRRGEFLVVEEGWSKKIVWCNLPNISTIWLEENR